MCVSDAKLQSMPFLSTNEAFVRQDYKRNREEKAHTWSILGGNIFRSVWESRSLYIVAFSTGVPDIYDMWIEVPTEP